MNLSICFLSVTRALGIYHNVDFMLQGSMKTVLECILTLKAHSIPNVCGNNFPFSSSFSKSGNISPQVDDPLRGPTPCGEDRQKSFSESKFQRALRSPVKSGMVFFVLYSSMCLSVLMQPYKYMITAFIHSEVVK